jgi:hypothetical protein
MMIDFDCQQRALTRENHLGCPSKWVTTLVFDQMKKFDVPLLVTKEA